MIGAKLVLGLPPLYSIKYPLIVFLGGVHIKKQT